MTHEYLRGVEDQDLSYSELKRMARTSLEHAFISGSSLWSDGKTFHAGERVYGCAVGCIRCRRRVRNSWTPARRARLQQFASWNSNWPRLY